MVAVLFLAAVFLLSNRAVTRGYWDPLVGADEDSVPSYTAVETSGFYNWYAATAGSGSYSMASGVANDSVCPKGWQLPVSYPDGKSVRNLLFNSYGYSSSSSNEVCMTPISYVRLGYISDRVLYEQGSYSVYWTANSTSEQGQSAADHFLNSGIVLAYRTEKGLSINVRCVKN